MERSAPGPVPGRIGTMSRAALRREFRRLQPLVDGLRRTACLVEKADVRAVRRACDDAYSLLTTQIIPHVAAQSVALASLIDNDAFDGEGSALSRDCRELVTLTHELGVLRNRLSTSTSAEAADELRRVLFGLYALVKLQFTKTEDVYLPLLSALSRAERRAVPRQVRRPGAEPAPTGPPPGGPAGEGPHADALVSVNGR